MKLIPLIGIIAATSYITVKLVSRRNGARKLNGLISHAFRLRPGQELKSSLINIVAEHNLKASAIVTCVGSLKEVKLRLANATAGANDDHLLHKKENFEILSLVGTLGKDGVHLHISLGDANGNVIGGHLVGDAYVFTTVEIVLIENESLTFKREFDTVTGYPELEIMKG